MYWSIEKTFDYGKINDPMKELRDLLFFDMGNEIPNEIRYPSRKRLCIGFSVGWNGFLDRLKNMGRSKRYRRLRIPLRVRFPIYRRTIFFFDGRWQEALQLGFIVNEVIGFSIINTRAVARAMSRL